MPIKTLSLEEKIALAEERHSKMQQSVIQFPSYDSLPQRVLDQMARLDRSKPRVLMLYYGGTLGMIEEIIGGVPALVPAEDESRLLRPLREVRLDERLQVVYFPILPKPIDSTNARWPHWVSIANAIELLYDDFDGFVIAGGTDTMSYMMAAMNFIFPNIGKPIIGAAAQQPIGEWGTDAVRNLGFSLDAATQNLIGAHLAFNNDLMHGLHVFKVKDTDYDAFKCPEGYNIGRYVGGTTNLIPGRFEPRKAYVTKNRLEANKGFRDGIEKIEINPFGYADTLLDLANARSVHAILLTTYGAGNVRDLKMFDSDPDHIEVLRELYENGFPLVLGSPMQDGIVLSSYAAGLRAITEGKAISGGNTTGSTLPVKMSRALYNSWVPGKVVDYNMFRREMYRQHVGELDTERIKDVLQNEAK